MKTILSTDGRQFHNIILLEFMTFSSMKSIGVLSICSVHWVFYHGPFQIGNTGGHIRIFKEAYFYKHDLRFFLVHFLIRIKTFNDIT
jgi:hypothetical protein